jgi:hypothetical protein
LLWRGSKTDAADRGGRIFDLAGGSLRWPIGEGLQRAGSIPACAYRLRFGFRLERRGAPGFFGAYGKKTELGRLAG